GSVNNYRSAGASSNDLPCVQFDPSNSKSTAVHVDLLLFFRTDGLLIYDLTLNTESSLHRLPFRSEDGAVHISFHLRCLALARRCDRTSNKRDDLAIAGPGVLPSLDHKMIGKESAELDLLGFWVRHTTLVRKLRRKTAGNGYVSVIREHIVAAVAAPAGPRRWDRKVRERALDPLHSTATRDRA